MANAQLTINSQLSIASVILKLTRAKSSNKSLVQRSTNTAICAKVVRLEAKITNR